MIVPNGLYMNLFDQFFTSIYLIAALSNLPETENEVYESVTLFVLCKRSFVIF